MPFLQFFDWSADFQVPFLFHVHINRLTSVVRVHAASVLCIQMVYAQHTTVHPCLVLLAVYDIYHKGGPYGRPCECASVKCCVCVIPFIFHLPLSHLTSHP